MSLPIPKELIELIENGFWPQDWKSCATQNLKPLVPADVIREFAPDEDKYIYFYQPSNFYTIRRLMEHGERFWENPLAALEELNPDLTLIIGDFGQGSDAPIALDFRRSLHEPSVIRLKWAREGNHWVEITPNFGAFATLITKGRASSS